MRPNYTARFVALIPLIDDQSLWPLDTAKSQIGPASADIVWPHAESELSRPVLSCALLGCLDQDGPHAAALRACLKSVHFP